MRYRQGKRTILGANRDKRLTAWYFAAYRVPIGTRGLTAWYFGAYRWPFSCIPDAPPLCKISDFGLARTMAADNAYVTTENMHAMLPLRWMAPESVRDHIYTTGVHKPAWEPHAPQSVDDLCPCALQHCLKRYQGFSVAVFPSCLGGAMFSSSNSLIIKLGSAIPASDIWSFGVTMWEVWADGQTPFSFLRV